jgi:hypothetical protein
LIIESTGGFVKQLDPIGCGIWLCFSNTHSTTSTKNTKMLLLGQEIEIEIVENHKIYVKISNDCDLKHKTIVPSAETCGLAMWSELLHEQKSFFVLFGNTLK